MPYTGSINLCTAFLKYDKATNSICSLAFFVFPNAPTFALCRVYLFLG